MNCFQIRNLTSDILDGAIPADRRTVIEAHLQECELCNEEFKHFRIILSSIASSPRITPKLEMKNTEPSLNLSDVRKKPVQRLRRYWRTLPWYIRTTLEGTGIVFLVLLSISAGPKLRTFYERQIERNVTEFNDGFAGVGDDSATNSELPSLAKGKLGAPDSSGLEEDGELAGDEYEIEAAPQEQEAPQDVTVGSSEIWRFILKTDSPKEIRNRIVQVLSELKIPRDTPGLGGIEAPGGIQFDLLVPINTISGIKRQLQKISIKAPDGVAKTGNLETFAWYRNKSRKALPPGRTRIVIWLSQI